VRERLVSGLALALLVAILGAAALPDPLVAAPAPQGSGEGARIDAPTSGARVGGQVEIRGRAVAADPSRFQFYRLHYGPGASPSSLRPIGSPGDRPVEDGVLAIWDTAGVMPGEYSIILTVYDGGRANPTASVVVTVEAPPTPAVRPTMAPLVVVTPGEVPPEGEAGPEPTPIPELPQLDPNIPQINVPPPAPGPAIPNIAPGPDSGAPPPLPTLAPITFPAAPAPALDPIANPAAPSFDPGPSGAPSNAPSISAPAPPPPPVIQPYVPPPALPTIVPPTPFGIPG